MSIGSVHGLTTQRAAVWQDSAGCLNEDPELFFPQGDSGPSLLTIEQAKAICRTCPVVEACAQWAADTRQKRGIYGGLTEQERASIRRAKTRRRISPEEAAKKAEQARHGQPRTMQSIHDESTVRLYGGHLAWTGSNKVHFKGQLFTPKRFCFVLDRGRNPDGPVRAECGIDECVLAAHLADTTERARCGTRYGYDRHLKLGEPTCAPCRRANADADNRLRRTGTTREMAS
jgi:hypothetical protein